MRYVLFSCVLALVACDDDTAPSSADLAAPDLATAVSCAATCTPACAPGLTCVAANGTLNIFTATCLASCTTTADCPTASTCVALAGASPSGRFCVSTTAPALCGTHC